MRIGLIAFVLALFSNQAFAMIAAMPDKYSCSYQFTSLELAPNVSGWSKYIAERTLVESFTNTTVQRQLSSVVFRATSATASMIANVRPAACRYVDSVSGATVTGSYVASVRVLIPAKQYDQTDSLCCVRK